MNEQGEEFYLADLSTDELLSLFLDACRDHDRDAAFDAIHELHYKIWMRSQSRLPLDPRPDPRELAELRRFSAEGRQNVQRTIKSMDTRES